MKSIIVIDLDGCIAIYPDGFPIERIKAGELTWDEAYKTAVPNYDLVRLLSGIHDCTRFFLTSRWQTEDMYRHTANSLREIADLMVIRCECVNQSPRDSRALVQQNIKLILSKRLVLIISGLLLRITLELSKRIANWEFLLSHQPKRSFTDARENDNGESD